MWFVVHPTQEQQQGLFFVDQSKTGSTSMGEVFWDAIMMSRGHIGSYHQTSRFLKFNYSKYWEPYHTFSVVRNPFDRFVSAFFFKVDKWHNNKTPIKREISEKEIYRVMGYFSNYSMKPQHDYVTEHDKVIVDQLIRYEKVKEEIEKLVERLKVPFVDVNDFDVCRIQKTRGKKDWRFYYDRYPDLWGLVSKIYEKDIELYLAIGGQINVQ